MATGNGFIVEQNVRYILMEFVIAPKTSHVNVQNNNTVVSVTTFAVKARPIIRGGGNILLVYFWWVHFIFPCIFLMSSLHVYLYISDEFIIFLLVYFWWVHCILLVYFWWVHCIFTCVFLMRLLHIFTCIFLISSLQIILVYFWWVHCIFTCISLMSSLHFTCIFLTGSLHSYSYIYDKSIAFSLVYFR